MEKTQVCPNCNKPIKIELKHKAHFTDSSSDNFTHCRYCGVKLSIFNAGSGVVEIIPLEVAA